MSLNESIVEAAALTGFGELGSAVRHGPQIAPGEPAAGDSRVGCLSWRHEEDKMEIVSHKVSF